MEMRHFTWRIQNVLLPNMRGMPLQGEDSERFNSHHIMGRISECLLPNLRCCHFASLKMDSERFTSQNIQIFTHCDIECNTFDHFKIYHNIHSLEWKFYIVCAISQV